MFYCDFNWSQTLTFAYELLQVGLAFFLMTCAAPASNDAASYQGPLATELPQISKADKWRLCTSISASSHQSSHCWTTDQISDAEDLHGHSQNPSQGFNASFVSEFLN